jgi:hypothetical protein
VSVGRGGIWEDEHGTCRIPTLYASSYFGVFLLCYHRDLVFISILVTWRIVAFAVAGLSQACQNFEIGDLPFRLALSSLRNFYAVAVFFHLL